MPKSIAVKSAAFGLAAFASIALSQNPESFAARLSWVPISGAERGNVSGGGTARATLTESLLSISGSFEGLPGEATLVNLHRGAATGARGPVIAELQLSDAADESFSGVVELDSEQLAALLAGHLYIEIHADGGVPPDNAVLWGWLLDAGPSSDRRRDR